MTNRWGQSRNSYRFPFIGDWMIEDGDCSTNDWGWWLQPQIKRHLLLGGKAMPNLDSVLKSTEITLLTNVHILKLWFYSSHGQTWELDHKEVWALKNWCYLTVVLDKPLGIPLDSNEIKPVNPKRNQPWINTGRTDAEAPILWPPDVKSWLIGKASDAGKDWRQEEKGTTEDEMVGWHHRLSGHEGE